MTSKSGVSPDPQKTAIPSVVHVCLGHAYSGLESWVLEMVDFQRRQGLSVRLVALADGPLFQAAIARGLQVQACPRKASLRNLTRTLQKMGRAEPISILHVHGSREFKFSLWWLFKEKILNKNQVRVILQFHIWISHSKRGPLHALSHRLIDQIWCSSEPAKRSIEKNIPVASEQIIVVRYGRPFAKVEAGLLSRSDARAKLGLPQDSVVLGTVSRIDRGKGSRELVEAMAEVMKSAPRLILSYVGAPTDDPKAKEFALDLKRQVESYPNEIKKRLIFHGFIENSFQYLRAFDLFLLPTYRECFSLALLEAQIAQVPCLVSDAGGSPEVVHEPETGWLCQPESTESLRDAILRALDMQNQWPQIAERAAKRVQRDFEMSSVLGDTISGYRKLLLVAKVSP